MSGHPTTAEARRLSSVWEHSDTDLLRLMIPMYLEQEPSLILDITWGSGHWWHDSPWPVVGLDILSSAPIRGDYRRLPFQNDVADVVVFDPPHRSEGGPNRSRLMENRFGSLGTRPDGLKEQLAPTLSEVARVLKKQGIALVKITDQTHWHHMVWQHIWVVNAGEEAGLTACDLIVKVRSHGITSSKWTHAYHALKRHTFWMVFRNGGCEPGKSNWRTRPGRP